MAFHTALIVGNRWVAFKSGKERIEGSNNLRIYKCLHQMNCIDTVLVKTGVYGNYSHVDPYMFGGYARMAQSGLRLVHGFDKVGHRNAFANDLSLGGEDSVSEDGNVAEQFRESVDQVIRLKGGQSLM